jgi:hypothetical protein
MLLSYGELQREVDLSSNCNKHRRHCTEYMTLTLGQSDLSVCDISDIFLKLKLGVPHGDYILDTHDTQRKHPISPHPLPFGPFPLPSPCTRLCWPSRPFILLVPLYPVLCCLSLFPIVQTVFAELSNPQSNALHITQTTLHYIDAHALMASYSAPPRLRVTLLAA